MFKRRFVRMGFLLGAILSVSILVLLAFRTQTQSASQAENPRPAVGIESLEAVELGGVEQWILIHGEDQTRPVLLWLHGGPGQPLMPAAHASDAELIKHFVVVHWDQRGAGKSYDPALTPEMLTTEQYIADTHNLAQTLRRRFGVPRIYLIGHSWGSQLGALTVARYPDLFYAFIGVSQPVSLPEAYRVVYPQLLDRARTAGNPKALGELEAIGPPPWSTMDAALVFSKWNAAFGGTMRNVIPEQLDEAVQESPFYTSEDFEKINQGTLFSIEAMWKQLLQINLFEQAPRLDVPVYFFQGRYDGASPGVLVERYHNTLEAPHGKSLVWFEESAHMPMYEEPDRFIQETLYVLEETYPLELGGSK